MPASGVAAQHIAGSRSRTWVEPVPQAVAGSAPTVHKHCSLADKGCKSSVVLADKQAEPGEVSVSKWDARLAGSKGCHIT